MLIFISVYKKGGGAWWLTFEPCLNWVHRCKGESFIFCLCCTDSDFTSVNVWGWVENLKCFNTRQLDKYMVLTHLTSSLLRVCIAHPESWLKCRSSRQSPHKAPTAMSVFRIARLSFSGRKWSYVSHIGLCQWTTLPDWMCCCTCSVLLITKCQLLVNNCYK